MEQKDKKTVKKSNIKKEDKELEKLKQLLGEEKEKSMRIQAEMMNFRKRKEEEVSNLYKYANEDILKELIQIIDNFERALTLKNEENAEFLKGFEMIYKSILKILEDNKVVEIESNGKPFDPNYHQAVLTEHVDGVEENTVIETLQKGYIYKDRVLRPAMVKVAN